jgi:hypothetical protein
MTTANKRKPGLAVADFEKITELKQQKLHSILIRGLVGNIFYLRSCNLLQRSDTSVRRW